MPYDPYGADEHRDSRYLDDDEYRRMREAEDDGYEYHGDAADDEAGKETVIHVDDPRRFLGWQPGSEYWRDCPARSAARPYRRSKRAR